MSGTRELGAQPRWSSCSLITFSPWTKNKLKISILSSDCTQFSFFGFLESHGWSIKSISLRILTRPLSTTSFRRERKKRSGSLRVRNRSSRASWKQYRSFASSVETWEFTQKDSLGKKDKAKARALLYILYLYLQEIQKRATKMITPLPTPGIASDRQLPGWNPQNKKRSRCIIYKQVCLYFNS